MWLYYGRVGKPIRGVWISVGDGVDDESAEGGLYAFESRKEHMSHPEIEGIEGEGIFEAGAGAEAVAVVHRVGVSDFERKPREGESIPADLEHKAGGLARVVDAHAAAAQQLDLRLNGFRSLAHSKKVYSMAAICLSTALRIKALIEMPACLANVATLLWASGEIRTLRAPE